MAKLLSRFHGGLCGAAGNHDYYHTGSFLWERFCAYADDNTVLLFETKPQLLTEYGLEVALYPAPVMPNILPNTPWLDFALPDRPPARWHLGIAHGTVEGILRILRNNTIR